MKSRLIVFLTLFLLIIAGVEIAMRVAGKSFHALTDPLLLKAAILDRSPETRVLFLGTSRFVDGIDQEQVSDTLEELTGHPVKVLNGATTGSQGDRSAYFAELATKHPGLTHVILEASLPALTGGDLGFERTDRGGEKKPVESNARKSKFADRFEESLQAWFHQHSALARHRKALRPKTLLKLPTLLLADHIDPNVWSRKGALTSLFSSKENGIETEIPAAIKPEIIAGGNADENLIVKQDEFAMMTRLCQIFEGTDLKVIWVAPPVQSSERATTHTAEYTAMYRLTAERYGIEFYDYSDIDLDAGFFRDPSHLNARGRRLFSRALARDLSNYFSTRTEKD